MATIRVDRWPITVQLHPAEYLPGWLMRVGCRYQLTPIQILRELRVPRSPTGYHLVLEHLSLHARWIAAHLGVPAGDLRAALWGRPIDAAAARYLVHHRHIRPDRGGSRFCARCLAEPDPWWHAGWANPLLPLCVRHQVYLQSTCEGCGQVPWTGTAWMSALAPPWQCPQRHAREPQRPGRVRPFCRYDLRDAAVLAAPAKLCHAQQNLIEFAALADLQPSRQLRYGTTDMPITEVLDELCRRFVDTIGSPVRGPGDRPGQSEQGDPPARQNWHATHWPFQAGSQPASL
ncbi:MAG: TniQ family protein [Rhodococcus sp. (in: high G+C Gram-positive bacteria)]|uniref:TniQ family protein n=1 Tax=Rhodococcus sp. TaxID=1831 RepID=UPI003BB5670E